MKFDRYSCGQQHRLRGWSRMVVKQFQDGGRPPFLKSIYRHISVKNRPIFMKFCTQQQILNWMNITWSKNEKVALDRLPSSTERINFLLRDTLSTDSTAEFRTVIKNFHRESCSHLITWSLMRWLCVALRETSTALRTVGSLSLLPAYVQFVTCSHTPVVSNFAAR